MMTTTVEYAGRDKTPIVILDNVLPENSYKSLRDDIRSRDDFTQGDANDVSFPGKIAIVDRQIVDPIIDAILASNKVHAHFPKEIFEQREYIRGFASVLCNQGWVHNDYMENELLDVVAPAAVFYFGFDRASHHYSYERPKVDTGTAFFREVNSGLERVTSIHGNKSDFCSQFPESVACHAGNTDGRLANCGAQSLFEETLRVAGRPNRLILYSQDILHNVWVEREKLPCSATEGRLAISLFFLSQYGGRKIVDALDNLWRIEATDVLASSCYTKIPRIMKQTEEGGKSLMERRRLESCPQFKLGDNFVDITTAQCSMESEVTVSGGQILKVRGTSSLSTHPELDRGGMTTESAGNHHFVVKEAATLILAHLLLKNAWNGIHPFCGAYCQEPICSACNTCSFCSAWSGGGGGACRCSNDGKGRCNCCAQTAGGNPCGNAQKGGAIRIEGAAGVLLIDVIFTANKAFQSTGNIFSTTAGAKLYLWNMSVPSKIAGITPILNKFHPYSCSAGKYFSTSVAYCISCSAGRFNVKSGPEFGASNESCIKCEAGTYNDETGSKACKKCDFGQYVNKTGQKKCLLCPKGTYSSKIGAKVCKICLAGEFSGETGSKACKKCDFGQYVVKTGQKKCLLCPKGTYSSKIGAKVCKICLAGQFSGTLGSPSCSQCPAGRALHERYCENNETFHDSLEDCEVCNANTYQSERGQSQCLACPPGLFVYADVSSASSHDSIEDCTTNDDIPIPFDVAFSITKGNNGNKTSKNGFYTSLITWSVNEADLSAKSSGSSFQIELSKTDDFNKIEHQLEGILLASRSHELDSILSNPLWKEVIFGRVRVKRHEAAGQWSEKSFPWTTSDTCIFSWLNDTSRNPLDWSCSTCPPGAYCDGGPWFSVKAKFGHYRVPSTRIPQRFDSCMFPGACLGAPNNDYSPNMYQSLNGSLSYSSNDFPESCNEEYGFQRRSRLCHACRYGFRRLGKFRCTLCPAEGQNYILLGLGIVAVLLALLLFVKGTVDSAGRTKISESIQKIMINYAQVITLFGNFPLRWPRIIEGMFHFQGSVSTVGEYLLNPDCVSKYRASELYYSKQIAYTLLPPLLVVICYMGWRIIACCTGVNFHLRLDLLNTTPKDKFVVSICVLLYLMYPTLCNQAFGLFCCLEVETGHTFLMADLEEECYTGRHLFMSTIFGLFQVVVYVIGLPLIGVYFLWRNHDSLDKHVVRTRYGLFLGGYRDERYYWEFVLVGRKVSVILMSVFGIMMKVEIQTIVVLLFILLAMLAESVGHPFDTTAGKKDRFDTPQIRYKTLHRLEMSSLFIIWVTLWCGLLIYLIDDINSTFHIILSILVLVMNVALMSWMVWKYVVEIVYEFKQEIPKKTGAQGASSCVACLTMVSAKLSPACTCKRVENDIEKSLRMSRVLSDRSKNDRSPWVKLKDPQTGKYYMYNEESGETKWVVSDIEKSENPLLGIDKKALNKQVEAQQQERQESTNTSQSNIEIFTDEITGKKYSYDYTTQETNWL